MSENILSFDSALAEVLSHAAELLRVPPQTETVPLLQAPGRILAEPIAADRHQPPFDRSTRDGYAIRAADASQPLTLIGSIRAGEAWQGPPLRSGEALEIMTGAPVPTGADAVVMIEHVSVEAATLRLQAGRSVRSGENIVPRGAEAQAGATLLQAGTALTAAHIAAAASCGRATLPVFARPSVSIVATGDELVELDTAIEDWQIRNSNSYTLSALVSAEGAQPMQLAIAQDTRDDTRARIAEGRRASLLILSGGVSMGKFDLVEEVLAELNAEFFFTGSLIQPGKPVVFGRLPATPEHHAQYFFGLPGNPVSTQVTFSLFVAPLLRALAGSTDTAPLFLEARLAEPVKGGSRVTRFLPAQLYSTWKEVTVRTVDWQGSGDLAANARANCYVVLSADVETFTAGEIVRVLLR